MRVDAHKSRFTQWRKGGKGVRDEMGQRRTACSFSLCEINRGPPTSHLKGIIPCVHNSRARRATLVVLTRRLGSFLLLDEHFGAPHRVDHPRSGV